MMKMDDGSLLLGTGHGLWRFDLAKEQATPFLTGMQFSKIRIVSLAKDPAGTLWIGTGTLGLFSYNPATKKPRQYTKENGLGGNRITALVPGHDHTLWIGTGAGGLNALDLTTSYIASYRRNTSGTRSLSSDHVTALCEHEAREVWIGTNNGLNILEIASGRIHRLDIHSTIKHTIMSIADDPSGRVWIAATDLGLLSYSHGEFTLFKTSNDASRSLNTILTLYPDPVATTTTSLLLWVGTHGGVDKVSDILEDSLSNLWVATSGNGLIRLEQGRVSSRFVVPDDSSGTRWNWIYSLVADHSGFFWLSTRGGLMSFDPHSNTFMPRTIEKLYDEHVFGIEADQSDNLWLSTSIGLGRFNQRAKTLIRYEKDDGILFTELHSRFFRSPRGSVFVGGLDGFTEFFPESVATTSLAPPIVITGLSILDKAMPATVFGAPSIDLTYDQKSFSLSFAALDYADPSRNSYAYRMVGLDTDWTNAGHRTYASYTNMDPGTYVFQVKGSNSNDVWNEAGTCITIVISPPYWRTWWFRIALVLLIVTTIHGAYRYRLRRLLDLERLRLRIANDLHDDVGSNLSAIAMVSRALHRAPELSGVTRRKLEEIYDTAVLISEGMKDLVWLIKPENDTLDNLLLRMKDTASTLLGEIPFEFHFLEAQE